MNLLRIILPFAFCLGGGIPVHAQDPEPFEQPELEEVEAYIADDLAGWTSRVSVQAHRAGEPIELVKVDRLECEEAFGGMAICDVTITARFEDGASSTVTVTDNYFGYGRDGRFTEFIVVTHNTRKIEEYPPIELVTVEPVATVGIE